MRIFVAGPLFGIMTQSAFPLGIITLTADAEFCLTHEAVGYGIYRHSMGDWGEVDEETRDANDEALKNGGPLKSLFTSKPLQIRFHVVTEADRGNTLVMVDSEAADFQDGLIRPFPTKD